MVYIKLACRSGLLKAPGRNGGEGVVGRHSLTYFHLQHHLTSFVGARTLSMCELSSWVLRE